MGDCWITPSTISGRGVKKSDELISGLKKISGARNRSYPTSILYGCVGCVKSPARDKNTDGANLACDGILSVVLDKIFVRFRVILPVLLHDVLTHVAMHFFHLSGDLQLILRRNRRHFPSFSHKIQHELRDISPRDGNMFDRTTDHVPLRTRDNVGDTIARVNNRSGQRAVRNLVGGPGGSEGEHCLDGDVETLDVERFKKDLRSLFSVLRRVERRFGLSIAAEFNPFVTGHSNLRYLPTKSSDPLAPPSDT